MRRLEDFDRPTGFTIVSWLDEGGAVTDDEDAIEDYLIELDDGERCLISAALFDTMSEAGYVLEAKAN